MINGVSVPTTIQGTHTITVAQSSDFAGGAAGCPGYTITSTVTGQLAPE